jgi:hypothetical protein
MESIKLPLIVSENEQKKILSYLWKIKNDRTFTLRIYSRVQEHLLQLQSNIERIRTQGSQ